MTFHVNTTAVKNTQGKSRYILRFEAPAAGRSLAGRRRGAMRYRIDGGALMRGKRQIGTVDANTGTIVIGERRFAVELREIGGPRSLFRWQVEVSGGDQIGAEDDALVEERAEILGRIACYLAWRQR